MRLMRRNILSHHLGAVVTEGNISNSESAGETVILSHTRFHALLAGSANELRLNVGL